MHRRPGTTIIFTLNNLTLNVYGPSGDNTQKFTASYEGLPLDLTVCPGQGNNCLNAFVLDATERRVYCSLRFVWG
jgi:hypothetical protein